ncbi:MAG: hypothetical protein U0U25_03715 [Flavobacteriales bacterium]
MKYLESGSGTGQALLFPVTIELNPSDHALVQGLLPELNALGFQLEPLSGRSFAVKRTPLRGGGG